MSMLTKVPLGATVVPPTLVAVIGIAVLQSAYLLRFKPLSKSGDGAWATSANKLTDCRIGPPGVLLVYRLATFFYTLVVGLRQLDRVGCNCFKFYTCWNWWLLVTTFGLLSAFSIRAAWETGRLGRQGAAGVPKQRLVNGWEYLAVVLMHIKMTTVLLVDSVTWLVMWPMHRDNPDPVHRLFWTQQLFNFTSFNQHAFNLVLVYSELLLDYIPMQPYMLAYVQLLTSAYATFALAYAAATREWVYPFLDSSKPWAPVAYTILLVTHWLFFALALCLSRLRMLLGGSSREAQKGLADSRAAIKETPSSQQPGIGALTTVDAPHNNKKER